MQLPPLRDGRDAPSDLLARRDAVAAAATNDPVLPPGVSFARAAWGGVPAVECATAQPVVDLLYLHGGGYRMGSAPAWAPLAGTLAAVLGARVVAPDYRLAPEHPFPAAVHDAAAVYCELAGEGRPLLVGGDSAGGGLAMALAISARDGASRAPDGVVLMSPWVDLTVSAPSYSSNAGSDQLFSTQSASDAADAYLQGHDPYDPLASALHADLRGLPPTIVFAGAGEVLLDDACSMAHRLATAGVAVELHVEPEMPHVWPFMLPDHDATRRALDDIARFAVRATGRA